MAHISEVRICMTFLLCDHPRYADCCSESFRHVAHLCGAMFFLETTLAILPYFTSEEAVQTHSYIPSFAQKFEYMQIEFNRTGYTHALREYKDNDEIHGAFIQHSQQWKTVSFFTRFQVA